MHAPSARAVRTAVASGLAVATLLTAGACSSDSNSDGEDSGSISVEPLPAAQSPAVTVAPAGTITPFAPIDEIVFDNDTRTLVALTDNSTSVSLVAGDVTAPPRVLDLGGTAADIVAGRDGSVLLPMNGSLARIDTTTGGRTDLGVDANALSAVDLPDGSTAVGDDAGTVRVFGTDGQESSTVSGASVTSADALASTDDGVTVLDRHQTSVTDLDVDDGTLGVALRAGEGAAKLVTDRFGRLLVTDSTGTELLVFTTHDLLMRQRFPVGAQPWGVAYDEQSDIVWLTLPERNEVVGYTLDTGIPVEVGRFPTVRQPNSIAVDSVSGDVFVGSATGDGMQRIAAAGR